MSTRYALIPLMLFAGAVWADSPKCFGKNELIADAMSKDAATAIAEKAGSQAYVRDYALTLVGNGDQVEWVVTQNNGLYSVWLMPSNNCINKQY